MLTVYDGASLVDLELPTPPEPFTLQPGEYRDFPVTLTASANGELTVESSISGYDVLGISTSADDSRFTRIGQDLDIDVVAAPDELALDLDPASGQPISKPVNLTITVRNISGAAIDNAKLDLLAVPITNVQRDPGRPIPLRLLRYVNRQGQTVLLNPGQSQRARDLALGDLAADEELTITARADAQDKARVRVTGIVRGVLTDAEGTREASGSGLDIVRIGQPKLLRVLSDDGATTVSKAGAIWNLNGTIQNISPDQTVTVRVLTQKVGNTTGTPVDDALAPSANPLGVLRELAPGERLLLSGQFTSDPEGGTRSIVNLLVAGWTPDETTGAPRELDEDEISVEEQPNGDPATQRRVAINTTDDPPAPWTSSSLAWNFTDGFARGFGRWTDGTIEFAQSAAFATVHAATWMFYLPATVYKYMSPLEREEEIERISNELAGAYAELQKISLAQAKAKVDQIVQAQFTGFWNAYETGDANAVAGMAGQLLGEATPDLVIDAAVSVIGTQKLIAHAGKTVLTKADAAQKATLASRVAAKGRKGFEPSDAIDFASATKYWGMDSALDDRLIDYAQRRKLVIAMRDRSPGSIKRLGEGALGKIEKVKSKNVNRLDVDYLGFAEEHLDFAMYKQMPNWDVIESRVLAKNPGLSGDERIELLGQVKERWWMRATEFYKERSAMRPFEQAGHIKVPSKKYGLNPIDNVKGTTYSANEVWDTRPFRNVLAGTDPKVPPTTDGLPAFQPQVNPTKSADPDFRPLTGDMDLIAILDANGKLLPLKERLQVYRELGELGFQHPESLTWVNDAGRAKYLKDFDLANSSAAEALLAYMPDGERRAVMFDSRKLFHKGAAGFMLLRGMRMTWDRVTAAITPGPALPDTAPEPADPAPDPADGETGYLGVPGDDGAEFDTGDDAPLLRENLDGSTSQWDPVSEQWVRVPSPPAGPVRSVPQSATTGRTPAGGNEVAIIGQQDVGGISRSARAAGGGSWFAAGQEIVINPGGRTQERATITAVSGPTSFRTTPLRFAHWPSETIAVVPKTRPLLPSPSPGSTPSGEPATPQTTSGNAAGTPQSAVARPTATKAPRITGTVRVGRRVQCSRGTWQGAGKLTYAYAWERRSGKRWIAIRGARTPTLTVPASVSRRQLRCSVTATNAAGSSSASSKAKTVAARR